MSSTTLLRSRHRRTWHTAPLLAMSVSVVMTGSLAGCVGVSGPTVVAGEGQTWSVGVSAPRFAGDNRCDDDPTIDTAVMTADLPVSGYGITLRADATEDDAHRIAGCLRDALSSGTITITPPSSE